LVSTLHSALHLLLDRTAIGPELMARLNQHLLESSGPNKFITLLVAEVDPASGRLAWLNAGHNPGVLMRPDGTYAELGPGGVPLGLFPRSTYRVDALAMAPGDLLCLYSDGITEASSPDDVEFGFDRLVALLAEQREAPLDQIIATIDARTSELSSGRPQGDDQTVLLLRRRR
jgi:serine phosphatase RsbU (regulator of sigma subunit)